MKSEQNFDEFLRNKFSDNPNFSFEEDKWARMEEMIIAQEAKKKRYKFFLTFIAGFATALLLVIPLSWYIFTGKENKTNEDLQSASNTPKGPGKKNKFAPDTNSSPQLSDPSKNTNGTGEMTAEAVKTDEKSTVKTALGSREIAAFSENRTKNAKPISSGGKNHSGSFETSDRAKTIQTEKEDTKPKVELTKELKTQQNFEMETDAQADKTDEAKTPVITDENLALKDSTNNKDTLAVTNNLADSLQPDTRLANSTDILPQDGGKLAFYAVSGLQYNLGYAKDDGASFSPFAALTVQVKLSPVWSLISGIGYFQVSKLTHEKTIVQRTYSFGYEENLFTIKQNRFHYVYVPVEMNYGKNKNNFSLGLNLAYLFANNNQIIEQQSNALGEGNGVKRFSYRYAYGLSSVDFQFGAAYSRDLGKKFKAGASYTIGTTDVRKNDWTENTTHEKNQFVRFTLMYKLK